MIDFNNPNEIFNYICHKCIERELKGQVSAVSVSEIAKEFSYSPNFAKSLIRSLKERGFIESVGKRGYKPTLKGESTNTYQKAILNLKNQI